MIKHIPKLLVALLLGWGSLSAQTLFSIDGQPTSVDEFRTVYLKNSKAQGLKETVDEYLDMYITFKLKVFDAKQMRLDTASAFRAEYAGYAEQLAQPYLSDVQVNQALIDEAYERLAKEVDASHILISIPANGDTLKAYNRALEARQRVLKGEAFGKVALETSNDPSVSRNNGRLGYFTAFQMVYPFESAAYTTPVGQVSMPVRTQFGYHIVQVHDVRPSRGRVKIAHIMMRTPQGSSPQAVEAARRRIVDVHTRLQQGADFAELAKAESEDPSTAPSGGEFPWIGSGQIIPQIEQVAFSLSAKGSISGPFQSPFGWHIVKLIDRYTLGSKEAELADIKAKIARDGRSRKSFDSFIAKLKVEYGFTERLPLPLSQLGVDTTVFRGQWRMPNYSANPVLFSMAGADYRLQRLAAYIAGHQPAGQQGLSVNEYLRIAYQSWVNHEILTYERQHLAQKYPSFRYLAQEYYEGMLLFEVSNLKVWERSTDSTVLADYYASNAHRYTWGQRVHYTTCTANDVAKLPKLQKLMVSKASKLTVSELADEATRKLKTPCTCIQGTANPGDAEVAIALQNPKGIGEHRSPDGAASITRILRTTQNEVKSMAECRGELTADLQQALEQQWLAELRQRHTVEVNKQALNALKAELQ